MSDLNRKKKSNIAALLSVIGQHVMEVFSSDSDSDETEDESVCPKRREIQKVIGYCERAIPNFDDLQFKRFFRLTRDSFVQILTDISPNIAVENEETGRPSISPEKQLLITLWTLANPESHRSISDRFGVSESTSHKCFLTIVQEILAMNSRRKIIAWHTDLETPDVIRRFEEASGFPGVVGAIDGCHIELMRGPSQNPMSYVNRKGFHSILLQGICDYQMKFIHCYAGEAGSVHDACMLRRSDIFNLVAARDDSPFFPNGSHIVGDMAYPLMSWLMVGFKDNGHLSHEQKKFNHKLAIARCVIERAFGHLKGRFRRLFKLDMRLIEMVPKVIIACCVLHNICIANDDFIDVSEINCSLQELNEQDLRINDNFSTAATRLAKHKRQSIMENL